MRVEVFIGDRGDRPQDPAGELERSPTRLRAPAHEAAARLVQQPPDVSVDLSPAVTRALAGGLGQCLLAAGAVLRTISPQTSTLADAIEQILGQARRVASGEDPFVLVVTGSAESPAAQPAVVGDGPATTTLRRPALTPLERHILARVSRGQTDGQIAAELFISRRTVQNHLHRVRQKTGMLTRADLIRWASTEAPAS
jgi:DNA-binding CsgD family transcriptional regulator